MGSPATYRFGESVRVEAYVGNSPRRSSMTFAEVAALYARDCPYALSPVALGFNLADYASKAAGRMQAALLSTRDRPPDLVVTISNHRSVLHRSLSLDQFMGCLREGTFSAPLGEGFNTVPMCTPARLALGIAVALSTCFELFSGAVARSVEEQKWNALFDELAVKFGSDREMREVIAHFRGMRARACGEAPPEDPPSSASTEALLTVEHAIFGLGASIESCTSTQPLVLALTIIELERLRLQLLEGGDKAKDAAKNAPSSHSGGDETDADCRAMTTTVLALWGDKVASALLAMDQSRPRVVELARKFLFPATAEEFDPLAHFEGRTRDLGILGEPADGDDRARLQAIRSGRLPFFLQHRHLLEVRRTTGAFATMDYFAFVMEGGSGQRIAFLVSEKPNNAIYVVRAADGGWVDAMQASKAEVRRNRANGYLMARMYNTASIDSRVDALLADPKM